MNEHSTRPSNYPGEGDFPDKEGLKQARQRSAKEQAKKARQKNAMCTTIKRNQEYPEETDWSL